MVAKFSIKSILAITAVFVISIWSSTAGAYNIQSTSTSNCTWNPLTQKIECSIVGSAVSSGLRNVVKTPVAYKVTLGLISGAIFCTNPADNAQHAQGQPFYDVVVPAIEGAQPISPSAITKNGKSLSEVAFEDPELIAALADAGFAVTCQNSNWIQRIVITQLRAFSQLVTEDSAAAGTCDLTSDTINTTGCTPVDNLLNYCELPEPYFSDPQQAVGTVVPYSCTELCHDTDDTACYFTYPTP